MTDNVDSKKTITPVTDPVAAITQVLVDAGHPNPRAWQHGLNPDALTNPDLGKRRFLVNRQLRMLLTGSGVNTMDERYSLVDQGELTDWVRLFKDGVAPCMVRNNLPRIAH